MNVGAFDGDAACAQLDVIRPIYAEVYVEPPYCETPQDVEDFVAGWPRRCSMPAFRVALAHDGGEPVGMTFGHQLAAGTGWWSGLLDEAPAGLTEEWPGRTFAIIEFAVRARWRRRGVGRALHAALLAGRTEERVTLLVRPEAEADPARRAYERWGYERVGRLRPFPDAPVYDAMVLDL